MKNKLRLPALACAAARALVLVGCGGSGSASSTAAASSVAGMEKSQFTADMGEAPSANRAASTDEAFGGSEEGGSAVLSPSTGESATKIVYNANLSLEAKDFTAAQQALTAAVEAAGGYLESSELNGSAEQHNRWASYTARIPVDKYRSFLAAAGSAGNVTSQSETAQNITSQYIDVEARLTALYEQRDRLNALADSAEATSDLLEIESQLSDVQYQIENYTQQMRAMDGEISYSTVYLNLNEVASLTPTDDSFVTRIAHAFTDGWAGFGSGVQAFLVAIVYLLPVLLLGFAIALLVWLIHRRVRRNAPPKPPVKKASIPYEAPTYAPPAAPQPPVEPTPEKKDKPTK